jgi:hypothetical protein
MASNKVVEKKTHCGRVLKRSLSDIATTLMNGPKFIRPIRSSSDPKEPSSSSSSSSSSPSSGEKMISLDEGLMPSPLQTLDHPAVVIKKIDDTTMDLFKRLGDYLTTKELVATLVETQQSSNIANLIITNGFCDTILHIKEAVEHYYDSPLSYVDQRMFVTSCININKNWETLCRDSGVKNAYDSISAILSLLDISLTDPAKKPFLQFHYEYLCLMFTKLDELLVD